MFRKLARASTFVARRALRIGAWLGPGEWISLVTGLATVAVSIVALKISSDSRDIKAAINNLSALATQTRRQADLQADELIVIRQQLDEARTQTSAIASQTGALNATAAAALQSAKAQILQAETASASATPQITLEEIRIRQVVDHRIDLDTLPLVGSITLRNTGTGVAIVNRPQLMIAAGRGVSRPGGWKDVRLLPGQKLTFDVSIDETKAALTHDAAEPGGIYIGVFAPYTRSSGEEMTLCRQGFMTGLSEAGQPAVTSWGDC